MPTVSNIEKVIVNIRTLQAGSQDPDMQRGLSTLIHDLKNIQTYVLLTRQLQDRKGSNKHLDASVRKD